MAADGEGAQVKETTTTYRIRQIFDDHGEYYAATEQIAAEIDAKDAEIAALSADAKAWRTLRRYERLLIAGFCSYADLNAAKAEAQQAAQEATT